ncbi:MAG TPA: tRNA lysidine(34) synthetase TilS [candidate division Zixibacteria bacterium]|nr:tRNA lysidine(34) synthetase TilS [candidate division Zixibacteria bacterium]
MSQLQFVKMTVQEQHLLVRGDRVLVALSGGPDSVALLHLLTKLRNEYELSLSAVYINHQIRKRAAAQEEKFCAELCRNFKVGFYLESMDIPELAKKQKKGIEETARDYRYEIFDRLAAEHSFDKIALGHHADDQAETVLFRILRGTGLTGLGGMPIKRGKIIRPLLRLRRSAILAYLAHHKLEFCTDQSNAGVDFARNYIRNRLLPEIRKNLNPSTESALLNLAATARIENDYLHGVTMRKFRRLASATPGGKLKLALEEVVKQPAWLRLRLLRHCLLTASLDHTPPDLSSVRRLEELVLGGKKGLSLPGKIQAVVENGQLIIVRRGKRRFEKKLMPGQTTDLPSAGLIFSIKILHYTDRIGKQRRSLKVSLDNSSIYPPLIVRNIRSGDRFSPLGMRGTKKVGDYLTDRKVDRFLRDEIPVVCDTKGIVWLVGYEIADRVKTTASTREVLQIEVAQRPEHQHEAV